MEGVMRRTRRGWLLASVTASLIVAAACRIDPVRIPHLSGPSELGLAVAVTVTPDILTQDGVSTTIVGIDARDAVGRPVAGLSVRLETWVGGAPSQFGRLSSRALTTGRDGRAHATYRAPEAPSPGVDVPAATIVTFVVMPVGTDAAATVPRRADLRLVPPDVVYSGGD